MSEDVLHLIKNVEQDPEPNLLMDAIEVFSAWHDGYAIRRSDWNLNQWIVRVGEVTSKDQDGKNYEFTLLDCLFGEWILVYDEEWEYE